MPDFAHAAGGLTKMKGFMDILIENLGHVIAIGAMTIAFIIVGYKIGFGKGDWSECVRPVLGCVIIAGASEIVQLFF